MNIFGAKAPFDPGIIIVAEKADTDFHRRVFDIATGEVIDFFDGLYCLREGLIETVIPSQALFRLDPRRAIRAVRFAARFKYDLSDEADAALRAEGPEYIGYALQTALGADCIIWHSVTGCEQI